MPVTHCGLVNPDSEKCRVSIACNGYSYMPFIAKPKAACELCLSWAVAT